MRRSAVLAGGGLVLVALALGLLAGSSGPWAGRESVTAEAAAGLVREELVRWGYGGLVPKEVMEFTNHFYVLVVEEDTGKGAMELIVEPDGSVHPEPGPNMMWNTKYGHMAGSPQPSVGTPPISRERARELARAFLRRTDPGTEPDEGTEFYGYFTFDVLRDGRPVGMLSVNAYTGQVWPHGWHGAFVRETEL